MLLAVGVVIAVALVLGIGIPAVLGGSSGVTISLPGGVHVYTGERYKGALWLQKYQRQVITELNKDQNKLLADTPTASHPGDVARWLGDWQQFHADLVRDASLPPNPDPQAEEDWSSMLTGWTAGSGDIIDAIRDNSRADAVEATAPLEQADRSALAFNKLFDLKTPAVKLPFPSTSPT